MNENHGMKITISTLALISLWIVIVPIYSFGYQTALRMRFFCSILCMIYIISHFNSELLKKNMVYLDLRGYYIDFLSS